MSKVLQVGNCGYDGPRLAKAITDMLSDAHVYSAHSIDEALAMIDKTEYELVLVNRILDKTGEEGMDLINIVKDKVKIMMITNYDDSASLAVKHGAVEGFGKRDVFTKDEMKLTLFKDLISTYLR
ncbi:MAG: DNA-binding NtrC family response regulator [Patescibacteria group bacterium]|jgi:DNA-binding NtrC family response regulator